MKIKVVEKTYDEVCAIKKPQRIKPPKQSPFFRGLIKTLSESQLKKAGFEFEWIGESVGREPALYLMNHSSFIDLMIATKIIYPNPFHIVCTSDGFVGKEKLMRMIGCIPTKKFVSDPMLIKDMVHVTKKLGSSVLMYPEASYSFDGTATPLPRDFGKLIKILNVPVVMIRTHGAFLRDPLYNCLQVRNVSVSATAQVVISKDDIKTLSPAKMSEIIDEEFTFDNFKEQQDMKVKVDADFRADGLDRVLYKCPHCNTEGDMKGDGIHISCGKCGNKYELTEYGYLKKTDDGEKLDRPSKDTESDEKFNHIPDWYKWERECVRSEIENGTYSFESEVDICMMVDMKAIYKVGEGKLTHNLDGFKLEGCGGKLKYEQHPKESYSLYSDYYWYEIGDIICIGNSNVLYYCFPKGEKVIVAKARLAAEEMFKYYRNKAEA